MSLSDRVYVIYEGKSMGELNTGATEPDENLIETVGLMMTGTPLAEIQQHGSTDPWLMQRCATPEACTLQDPP